MKNASLLLFSLAGAFTCESVNADELVKSRIVVIMDTSGSMRLSLNSNRNVDDPGGDGVASILGLSSNGQRNVRVNSSVLFFDHFEGFDSLDNADGRLNNSRMFVAKQALRSVIENYPGIEFSLMRFPQRRERVCATQCVSSQFSGSVFDPVNNPVHADMINRVDRCTHLLTVQDASDDGCFDDVRDGRGNPIRGDDGDFFCPGFPRGLRVHESIETEDDLTSYSNYQTPGSVLCGTRYRSPTQSWCPAFSDPYPPHGDLLVGFPGTLCTNEAGDPVECWPSGEDNRDGIIKWMNNREPIVVGELGDHGEVFDDGLGHQMGNFCSHTGQGDCELRARGSTPIAGSLLAAGQYLSTVQASDPKSACRPYSIVLLTDGEETCDGDPVDAARRIYQGAAQQGNGDFPGNVHVYVIGLSLLTEDNQDDQDVQNAVQILNEIAQEGGTQESFPASNLVDISSAFSKVIQDSLLVETCNGQDDDCDEVIDEGYSLFCNIHGLLENGQGEPFLNEFGDFQYGGDQVPNPSLCYEIPETKCDGLDDDCDGQFDEGLRNVCGQCLDAELEESCGNLVDDDCDQRIDEDCERCLFAEVCNFPDAADDDCDGEIDEGLGLGDPCEVGQGQCLNEGALQCAENGNVICNVSPHEPVIEECNGLDDDCDGKVDEGDSGSSYLIQACYQGPENTESVGYCEGGVQYCLDGQFQGQCFGQILPSADDCDGQDNDCDGKVDEEIERYTEEFSCPLQCQVTVCSAGGVLECTVPPNAQQEICNQLDDDCDGNFDEMDVQTCGISNVGSCRLGFLSCLGVDEAAPFCVGSVDPVLEICDGLDNDCDESTDEDFAVGSRCNMGEGGELEIDPRGCGVVQCDLEGGSRCEIPEEICDRVDNDCDGNIDENRSMDENPEGICDAASVCIEGQCASECQADAEFGITLCPGNQYQHFQDQSCFCLRSECTPPECALEILADSDNPNRIFCAPDQVGVLPCLCDQGKCSHVCEKAECAQGFTCDPSTVEGRCVPTCELTGCGENSFCNPVSGQCQVHPCVDVSCDHGEVCQDGQCVGSCAGIECGAQESCKAGRCVMDLCAQVDCGGNEVCNPESGHCERGCSPSCANGTVCDPKPKSCALDTCLVTTCGEDEICQKGQCIYRNEPDSEMEINNKVEKRVFVSGGCVIAPRGGSSGNSHVSFHVQLLFVILLWRRRWRIFIHKSS